LGEQSPQPAITLPERCRWLPRNFHLKFGEVYKKLVFTQAAEILTAGPFAEPSCSTSTLVAGHALFAQRHNLRGFTHLRWRALTHLALFESNLPCSAQHKTCTNHHSVQTPIVSVSECLGISPPRRRPPTGSPIPAGYGLSNLLSYLESPPIDFPGDIFCSVSPSCRKPPPNPPPPNPPPPRPPPIPPDPHRGSASPC
jgi:hypothetical protein